MSSSEVASLRASGKSLQEFFAPKSICFGCGPANEDGLRIRSFLSKENPEEVICDFQPARHHQAFPGMLNGGIIGSLLDCHCNWTAVWGLKNKWNLDKPPCTVTAEYRIQLLRPTPVQTPVHLTARVVEYVKQDRAWVEGELWAPASSGVDSASTDRVSADRVITAKCRGLFIAVREGHPAYHRW